MQRNAEKLKLQNEEKIIIVLKIIWLQRTPI